MSDREFQAAVVGWSVGVLLMVFVFASAAHADQVCQQIYDPINGTWSLQCVERDNPIGPPPRCRQVYDAMNGVWVTVCE